MNHHILLIIHLLAASVWVGGHLLLCLRYLPKAVKQKNISIIRQFEQHYEPVGLPALALLIITGVMMAYDYNVTISTWFTFSNSIEKVVSLKLIFLFITLLLAIHARLFIIPKLSEHTLNLMAIHIIAITIIGVTMLVLGSFVRIGGI